MQYCNDKNSTNEYQNLIQQAQKMEYFESSETQLHTIASKYVDEFKSGKNWVLGCFCA